MRGEAPQQRGLPELALQYGLHNPIHSPKAGKDILNDSHNASNDAIINIEVARAERLESTSMGRPLSEYRVTPATEEVFAREATPDEMMMFEDNPHDKSIQCKNQCGPPNSLTQMWPDSLLPLTQFSKMRPRTMPFHGCNHPVEAVELEER